MTAEVFPLDHTGRSLREDAAELQSLGPAVRVELPGGVIAWSVTRYELLKQLSDDGRLSRDAQQHWPGLPDIPEGWPLAPFLISPTVLNAYGSDRHRLREIMEGAFTPERLETLRENLGRRVPLHLGSLGAPGSLVDIRAKYAQVIAYDTLCDLFGVPEAEWPEATGAMRNLLSPTEDADQANAQLESAMGYLARLLSGKKNAPGEDMATTLAQADMTDEERVLALAVTIAGGVPATTELITNAVYNMLRNPEQLAAVKSGETTWSAVVEETLRFDAPVQHMPLRYAVEDIDLGEGAVIRQGDPVIMGFGAGGRDPKVHGGTTEVFDVHRVNKEHVAFGHGVHHCIGAPLGRIEASVALQALFSYFPYMKLAESPADLQPLPTFIFNGKAELPVRL
ncbi:cytochrome P450 [Streptomyces sp. TRM 70361]|uniref:cytochrome P450 n=1 Tax=Streptomyces sp. TRM 70361 TaxID=3116553 RepID=UPI002E7C2FF9|nr:cytochrome P450 [Streptomyces sp. TRM 70361]MEE1939715.1 cytochrome P450 [Streptomyces sp. TRM 70361]